MPILRLGTSPTCVSSSHRCHQAPRTYLFTNMGTKSGGGTEAEPRAAATLVILRSGHESPEVLITIRPKELRFMGGVAVFPGGAVAPADFDPRWADCSTLDPSAA